MPPGHAPFRRNRIRARVLRHRTACKRMPSSEQGDHNPVKRHDRFVRRCAAPTEWTHKIAQRQPAAFAKVPGLKSSPSPSARHHRGRREGPRPQAMVRQPGPGEPSPPFARQGGTPYRVPRGLATSARRQDRRISRAGVALRTKSRPRSTKPAWSACPTRTAANLSILAFYRRKCRSTMPASFPRRARMAGEVRRRTRRAVVKGLRGARIGR